MFKYNENSFKNDFIKVLDHVTTRIADCPAFACMSSAAATAAACTVDIVRAQKLCKHGTISRSGRGRGAFGWCSAQQLTRPAINAANWRTDCCHSVAFQQHLTNRYNKNKNNLDSFRWRIACHYKNYAHAGDGGGRGGCAGVCIISVKNLIYIHVCATYTCL